jgi:hypothetical protein
LWQYKTEQNRDRCPALVFTSRLIILIIDLLGGEIGRILAVEVILATANQAH